AWQPDSPAIERRHGIDSYPVEPVRACLVERNDIGMRLGDVQQEILVADARQAILLGSRRQSWQVVDGHFLDALDIVLGRVRQRRPGEDLRPGLRWISYYEPILAERLSVEEHRRLERGKELLVDALRRQRRRVDA